MAEKEPKPTHSAKECQETFTKAADMLHMDDEEREEFIRKAMLRAGHKPTLSWSDPEPEEGERGSSGGWFPQS